MGILKIALLSIVLTVSNSLAKTHLETIKDAYTKCFYSFDNPTSLFSQLTPWLEEVIPGMDRDQELEVSIRPAYGSYFVVSTRLICKSESKEQCPSRRLEVHVSGFQFEIKAYHIIYNEGAQWSRTFIVGTTFAESLSFKKQQDDYFEGLEFIRNRRPTYKSHLFQSGTGVLKYVGPEINQKPILECMKREIKDL